MPTIITINYYGSSDTIELLRSLERQSDQSFDVIVVDNDSDSAQREALAAYAATSPLRLDVIYSDRNRGFAGGCNLGIRKALAQRSDWILLLNNDTRVGSEFVRIVRAQLPSYPAMIAIPLKEGDSLAFAGRVRWLSSTLSHSIDTPPPPDDPLAYVIGGAALIHKDIFERVGLLDERYFIYFEDTELSLRARRAGFPFQWWSQPVVQHKVSASTSRLGKPLLLRYHMRNALLFNAVQGPWWARCALPGWSIFSMFKQMIKIALFPARRPQSYAIAAGIIDYYAHRFGRIADRRHRV